MCKLESVLIFTIKECTHFDSVAGESPEVFFVTLVLQKGITFEQII